MLLWAGTWKAHCLHWVTRPTGLLIWWVEKALIMIFSLRSYIHFPFSGRKSTVFTEWRIINLDQYPCQAWCKLKWGKRIPSTILDKSSNSIDSWLKLSFRNVRSATCTHCGDLHLSPWRDVGGSQCSRCAWWSASSSRWPRSSDFQLPPNPPCSFPK